MTVLAQEQSPIAPDAPSLEFIRSEPDTDRRSALKLLRASRRLSAGSTSWWRRDSYQHPDSASEVPKWHMLVEVDVDDEGRAVLKAPCGYERSFYDEGAPEGARRDPLVRDDIRTPKLRCMRCTKELEARSASRTAPAARSTHAAPEFG